MTIVVSYEQASQRRRSGSVDGVTGAISGYMGKSVATVTDGSLVSDANGIYPVGYLVEMDPGCVLRTHFHEVDQFQVFLPCDGLIGRKTVEHPLVLFTAAYSAYGPITAVKDEMLYLTLRNGVDAGARFLPEERDYLVAHRRTPSAAYVPLPNVAAGTVASSSHTDLLAGRDAGLACTYHELAQGDEFVGEDPARGRGQFWIVYSGACEIEGRQLGRLGLAFVAPGDAPIRIVGGEGGGRVLGLQFPRPD